MLDSFSTTSFGPELWPVWAVGEELSGNTDEVLASDLYRLYGLHTVAKAPSQVGLEQTAH